MSTSAPLPDATPAFFHQDSNSVRFWVQVDDQMVGASIAKDTLHHRYRPGAQGDDPMETYAQHARELDDVVRRRVASGSIEPVMLREYDLRAVSGVVPSGR